MRNALNPEANPPTKYIETRIRDVNDASFQSLIQELCLCVGFNFAEMSEMSLSFLLMAIGRENRRLTSSHAPVTNILSLKLGKLPCDSIVRDVCSELANLTGTSIEAFDEQTVLTVIRKQHVALCPKPKHRRLTRTQKRYDFITDLIKRRRQNGSL